MEILKHFNRIFKKLKFKSEKRTSDNIMQQKIELKGRRKCLFRIQFRQITI